MPTDSIKTFLIKAKEYLRSFIGTRARRAPTQITQTDNPEIVSENKKSPAMEKGRMKLGPYTWHLRKRQGNILFPENRRVVTEQEWKDAETYDVSRIESHYKIVASFIGDYFLSKGRFDSKAFKEKTFNDLMLSAYHSLRECDNLILDYVFLQGTCSESNEKSADGQDWDPEQDTYFNDGLIRLRNNYEEKIRLSLLANSDDGGIRIFFETRANNSKTSFEKSHFLQLRSRDCVFIDKVDFYPRLFSESDATLGYYVQYCAQSKRREDLMKELKENFILCHKRLLNPVFSSIKDISTRNDSPLGIRGANNIVYATGMLSKGRILGLLG